MGEGSERLRFFLELIDKVTAPANRITKSMSSVTSSLKAVAQVDKASGGIKGFGGMFRDMGSRVGGAVSKVASFAPALRKVGGGMATFASGVAGVTTAGLAFGAVGIGIAAAGAHFAIDAASFKRNTVNAFELLLGSRQEAEKVYKTIDTMADDTPFEARTVFDTFKALKATGMSVADSQNAMKGIFDVAVLGDPANAENKINELTRIMQKMQGMGKASYDNFSEFITASKIVTLDRIAQGLVDVGGASDIASAKAKILKGGLDSAVAQKALLRAISASTGQKDGALGGATAKFGSGSWEGQISTFKSRLGSIFEDIDIGPLIAGLQRINDGLKAGTPAGDALRASINALGGEAGSKIAAMFTPEKIAGFVKAAAELLPIVINIAKAFSGGAFETFTKMLAPLGGMMGTTNASAADMEARFRMIGQAIGAVGAVLGYLGFLIVAIGVGFVKLGEFVTMAVDAIAKQFAEEGIVSTFVNFGRNVVLGLVRGIMGAFPGLKDAWNAAVSVLPAIVANQLKIASPSRVMQKMGVFTVQGFTEGIESQVANNNDAMSAAVSPASVGMASMGGGAAAAAQAGGGGKGGVSIGAVHVTVDGGGSVEDAKAKGEAAADGFRSKLATILDELDREAA